MKSSIHEYFSVRAFSAVMKFIAKEGKMPMWQLYSALAKGVADEYGVNPPPRNREASVRWILKRLQATSYEDQYRLVQKIEPLFHSAWEHCKDGEAMFLCAEALYPPREPSKLVSRPACLFYDLAQYKDGKPLYRTPYVTNDQLRLLAYDALPYLRSVDRRFLIKQMQNKNWVENYRILSRKVSNDIATPLLRTHYCLIRNRLGTPGLALMMR